MDARMLVQSKFLVSESFGIGDVPREPLVTIESAKLEMQEEEGGKKERWGLLYFKEPWARPLKINRTHQRALILMFGQETNDWAGKQILLYAMAGTFFGKRQTAVRIRGSPQLKAPCSFTVKKFGGGSDSYKLEPIGPKGAALTLWWDKLKQVAAEHKVAEDRLKQLTKHTLKRDKISPSEITESDFAELCTAIAAEASAPAEPGATG
jgi:hypothetical protein